MTNQPNGMRYAVLLSLVHLLVLVPCAADKVTIGILYSGSGDQAFLGSRIRTTSAFWLSLNPTFALGRIPELVYCDVASTRVGTVACFHRLTAAHNISVFTAPELDLAEVLAPLTDAARIPLIASASGLHELFICDQRLLPPCTRPYGRRFQYLISNGPTSATGPLGIVGFLRSYGAARVAVVHGSDAYNTAICGSIMRDALNNRMNVVFNTSLTFNDVDTTAEVSRRVITEVLKPLDPDVVVWCNAPMCRATGEAFWDSGYYPRSLVATQCVDSIYGLSPEGRIKLRYALGGGVWDPRLVGHEYSDDGSLPYCNNFVATPDTDLQSAQLFAQGFAQFTGGSPATFTEAGIYVAFYLIEAAVALAGSTIGDEIMQAMVTLNLPTFRGRLQIDSEHMISYGGNVLTQMSSLQENMAPEILFPSSSFTAQLIYPAPKFEERTFTVKPFDTPSEVAIASIGCLIALFSAMVAVCLVRWRHTDAIRVLDWKLCVLSLLGVMLCSLAPLTWTEQNTQVQCNLRLFTIVGAFACMFAPLVGVFARILAISCNLQVRRASKFLPHSWLVVLLVAIQLLFCGCVLLAWYVRAPLTLSTLVRDPLRPSTDVRECASSGWSSFGAALLVYFFAVLLAIVGMALFIQRIVRDARFDRFRSVLNASFIWMVLVGVIVLLEYYAAATPPHTFGDASGRSAAVPLDFLFLTRSVLLYVNNIAFTFLMFYNPLREAVAQQSRTVSASPVEDIRVDPNQLTHSIVVVAGATFPVFPIPRAVPSGNDGFSSRESI